MPTPQHAVFDKDVGTWDGEVTQWTQEGPQRSTGVLQARRISGGRWLVTDFVNLGTGFEGHGVYGWDTEHGYVGTWVDNGRGFLAVLRGTWDPETRTMEFRGEHEVGGRAVRWRETTTTVAEGHQVYRTFVPTPGGELEVLTVNWWRR